jgi:phenylalanyl-tRNA synthetase beta chain
MPPILNSEKTKIELSTKNIFIDCTALDYTRALNSVICLCAAFSIYCPTPFTIEQVSIVQDGERTPSPLWESAEFDVDLQYIQRLSGLPLSQDVVIELLRKMMLVAIPNGEGKLKVIAPATRSDILHACDVAEDVMIAYGYDRICREIAHPISAGYPLAVNEYTDRVRREVVACGWNEVLTFSLCSARECFDMLGLPVTDIAVRLRNSKTLDYEIVRTTLISGMLRVTRNILDEPNTKNTLPLRLFEISDVVLLDPTSETNTRNFRRICATIADTKSRFQEIHGLLDRFFVVNGYAPEAYKLVANDSPTCIPGQRAQVLFAGKNIGWIGVIYPQVLINFGLTTPVVAFEIEIEPFLVKHY